MKLVAFCAVAIVGFLWPGAPANSSPSPLPTTPPYDPFVPGAPPLASIHAVDFRNFVFHHACESEGDTDNPAVLHDGDWKGDGGAWATLDSVIYGGIENESEPVAVVTTECSGGGSLILSTAYLFGIRHGHVTQLAIIAGGDRALGGIAATNILFGRIAIDQFYDGDQGEICCVDHIRHTVFGWTGIKLVQKSSILRPAAP
jgi:hypothetical protein